MVVSQMREGQETIRLVNCYSFFIAHKGNCSTFREGIPCDVSLALCH